MTPFDLERALAGDKVVNGEGDKVSEITFFTTYESKYPVCAIINGTTGWYSKQGAEKHIGETYNLHMDTKSKTFFVNIYKDGTEEICVGVAQNSREKCIAMMGSAKYIKTIEIEVEL